PVGYESNTLPGDLLSLSSSVCSAVCYPGSPPEPGIEMEGLASRRQSETIPLTPEPQEVPPQKRKKKKKAQTQDMEEPELVNGDVMDQHTDGEEHAVTRTKTKRKKKSKIDMHYANDLGVEEGDIVSGLHHAIPQHSLFSSPLGHSQPVGKVFVERNKRFQATDPPKHNAHLPDHMEDYMEVRPLWTTRDVAMRVHSGFRPPGSEHQILQPWIVVNLVIALLVGLAWAFVSTRPDMDYTEEFLMAMAVEDLYPRHDDNPDLSA
uniref:Transmembrane protein 237a n=1 Tax=Oncorhynchus kisutch TaxID=8019 RepID=A0A8C7N0J3_ONCKI